MSNEMAIPRCRYNRNSNKDMIRYWNAIPQQIVSQIKDPRKEAR